MYPPDPELALWEAVASGDADAVERALTQGADINRSAALRVAVERGNFAMVSFLLERGADPSEGLHAAAASTSPNPILQLLLTRGADANAEEYESITALFRAGSYAAAKMLLDAGANPNHRCYDGDTPLMWAAYQRDWSDPENPLIALLDAGADPNINNEEGGSVPTTALIWAARAGHEVNVRILLERGADPNLVDCTGTTALLTAAAAGHTQIVRDLMQCGADPSITDREGATARLLAERHCVELLALLRGE